MPEVALGWISIPSRGHRNTASLFMTYKSEISADLMGHLARIQTVPCAVFV